MALGMAVVAPVAGVAAAHVAPGVVPEQDYGTNTGGEAGSGGPVPPGGEVRAVGSRFCPNTDVLITVEPAVAGFPQTKKADANGNVEVTFTAPGDPGTYRVTFSGLGVDAGCDDSVSTDIPVQPEPAAGGPVPPLAPQVPDVAASGPIPGAVDLPAAGSQALVQARNAALVVLAGVGLVAVAWRRKRTHGGLEAL